jgi:hypothetical protein
LKDSFNLHYVDPPQNTVAPTKKVAKAEAEDSWEEAEDVD